MKFFVKIPLLILVCALTPVMVYANIAEEQLARLTSTKQVPAIYDRVDTAGKASTFYFSGQPYQGKETRIFATYNTPSQGKAPFPAIVLVHGGGGTASSAWVKKWNDAGFAAISIAVEGQTNVRKKGSRNQWLRHQWSGPARVGIYGDGDKALTEQWMFHATSAVIQAHNLLRSLPEINHQKIGLSGISWGGVITSTVLGFDQRFAFAIPIYGSGNLDTMANQYLPALATNQTYRTMWEPILRIARYTKPTMWLTGLKEQHFSLDAQAATYGRLKGQRSVSIQPQLKHSHPAGWTPAEPYAFAQAVINDQALPAVFSANNMSDYMAKVTVKTTEKLVASSLFYTTEHGHTGARTWHQVNAMIQTQGDLTTLCAILPQHATAWFFNVETNGLTFSSDFYSR